MKPQERSKERNTMGNARGKKNQMVRKKHKLIKTQANHQPCLDKKVLEWKLVILVLYFGPIVVL